MKKTDLANLSFHAEVANEIIKSYDNKITEIISQSFSSLVISNPDAALSLIDQLVDQKQKIEDLIKERSKIKDDYLVSILKNIPDSLTFDAETLAVDEKV